MKFLKRWRFRNKKRKATACHGDAGEPHTHSTSEQRWKTQSVNGWNREHKARCHWRRTRTLGHSPGRVKTERKTEANLSESTVKLFRNGLAGPLQEKTRAVQYQGQYDGRPSAVKHKSCCDLCDPITGRAILETLLQFSFLLFHPHSFLTNPLVSTFHNFSFWSLVCCWDLTFFFFYPSHDLTVNDLLLWCCRSSKFSFGPF